MKFTSLNLFGRGGKKIARPFDRTKEHNMNTITRLMTKSQAGTIAWLNDCIEKSQHGVFAEITTVTPGLAGELLRRNEGNRNIKDMKLRHFAADMLAGRWKVNGEPVIISKDGMLNDGQHRMNAIIEANKPLEMVLVFGVSRESRMTIDQGSARGAGDYLSMQGFQYANNLQVVAKWVMAYEASGGINISGRSSFTNAEVVARAKADDALLDAVKYASSHYKHYRHMIGLTAIATAFYVASEIDEDDAIEYFDQVCLGENIKRGDPAFTVREYLNRLEKHDKRLPALETLLHGWNKFRTGSKMKIVRLNGSLPALV